MDVADHVHAQELSRCKPTTSPLPPAMSHQGCRQTVMAFLAEKERRSGSRRTVEVYARMLWPFLSSFQSPAQVTPARAGSGATRPSEQLTDACPTGRPSTLARPDSGALKRR